MRYLLSAAATAVASGLATLATAAFAASAGVPDKNGIIWDDPKPAPATAPASSPVGANDNVGIVWNAPAKASGAGLPATPHAASSTAEAVSAQCHEFQTTIVIDGRKQPAHGTVCRQPDGSWRVVDK